MSYAYTLSERARAGLGKMDTWLQEETLDELDRIAAEPTLTGRRVGEGVVRDFVRDRGDQRAYVFITVFPDEATQTFRVSDIGCCFLPRGTTSDGSA